MTKRLENWIDEDEYPDERDIEDLGDDAPTDYDPRTIGYVGRRPAFWTPARVVLLIIVGFIVSALLLPELLPLLR